MAIQFDNANNATSNVASNAAAGNGAAEQNRPTFGGAAPQGATTMAGAPSVSIFAAVNSQQRWNNGLNPAAQQFLNDFEEAIKYINEQRQVGSKWAYEMVKLTMPAEARVAMIDGYAVPLIFSEFVNNTGVVFASVKQAYESIHQLRPSFKKILNPLIITKDDYQNGRAFAYGYAAQIISMTEGTGVTAESLKEARLEVHDVPSEYDAAYAVMNPHKDQLRADVKLTVYAVPKAFQKAPNLINNEAAMYNANTDVMTPIATVGVYTEWFRAPAQQGFKYQPVVHISEISSVFKSTELLGLILVQAIKVLRERAWDLPYRNFGTKDANGNVINVGNLFVNADGSLWSMTTPDEYVKTKQSSFLEPLFVIDVTLGRFMVSGLAELIGDINTQVNTINTMIGACDAQYAAENDPGLITPIQRWYRGFYNHGSKVIDTANIDYLTEITKTPKLAATLEELLNTKGPDAMMAGAYLEAQKRCEDSSVFYYHVTTVALSASLMTALEAGLQKWVALTGFNNLAPQTNVGFLTNLAASQNQIFNGSGQTAVGGYNPGSWMFR